MQGPVVKPPSWHGCLHLEHTPFTFQFNIMSSPTTDPSSTLERKQLRLLALPVEIKQLILTHLSDSLEPTLAILRRTHSCFYHLISKTQLRPEWREQLDSQLHQVETTYPYLMPKAHFICYECLYVLPEHKFNEGIRRSGKHGRMRACPARACSLCETWNRLHGRRD